MNQASPQQQDGAPIVYGFLDDKTQIFYTFELYDHYQQFLEMVASGEDNSASGQMVDEDELKANEERTTEELTAVFRDSFFARTSDSGELKEIDF